MAKHAAPPDVIRWIPRSNEHGDCAVAAIAFATGYTYEETLSACLAVKPDVLLEGLRPMHIRRTLAEMGFKSRRRVPSEIDEDTGLLWIEDRSKDAHLVYLWAGRVVNPSTKGEVTALWLNADDYLKNGGWKVKWLFTVEDRD